MAFCILNGKEPALDPIIVSRAMQYDRVIEQALRDVRDPLLANLAPAHNLSDERTIACLLAIMGKPEVGYALERGNDTAQCFALRAVKHILSDRHQPPRAAINRLWDVMDGPNSIHFATSK